MAAIDGLLDETRLLWHTMARTAEHLHRTDPITLGTRAVMEFIAGHGPSTVPRIARSRGVTRQHVQALVNSLLEADLVALRTNPDHRRSQLVGLTREGERLIERVKLREKRFLGKTIRIKEADLDRASNVLRTVRQALEEGR